MALRKCEPCGGNLPAGATARAKFCSATCRKRASRARQSSTPSPMLKLVATPVPTPIETTSRLEALEATAARLDRLLDESDPRSAAPLNKEYRETLREIESLREVESAKGEHGRRVDRRQQFSAGAI